MLKLGLGYWLVTARERPGFDEPSVGLVTSKTGEWLKLGAGEFSGHNSITAGNPWDWFKLAGFPLERGQKEQLLIYLRELLKWNERINLTSLRREEEVIAKHFLGSLAFLRAFEPISGLEVADLGAGAGFPGLPIKIYCPEIYLTLIEASQKKAAFLKHIGRILGLEGVRYEAQRSEALIRQGKYLSSFDMILCRAVGTMGKVISYSLPLLKVGGSLVVQKGEEMEEETQAAARALADYRARMEKVIPVELPPKGIRFNLLVVKKMA